ncbi:MAG: precorrin-8X methylmutase [Coprococcus catus]|nr:precorrin-8X methylmutase [Coprococcus catus]
MRIELENVLPAEIEKRSFEIITEELGDRVFDPLQEPIIKRAIHTSADFEYADSLCFSEHAVEKALDALRKGAYIVTDTQMGKSGINKKVMAEFGGEVCCFMSDPDVAETAKKNGTTRAVASMEKAAKLDRPLVFAIGNAPTALIRLHELIEEGIVAPALVIGVPVGFVNVVEAKELFIGGDTPYIIARGRKGGSNVAASIVNALLYQLVHREGF